MLTSKIAIASCAVSSSSDSHAPINIISVWVDVMRMADLSSVARFLYNRSLIYLCICICVLYMWYVGSRLTLGR